MYISFLEKDSYRKVFLFVLLIVTIIVSIISSKEEPVQDNTVIEIVKHVQPEKINHEREYEEIVYTDPVINTKPIVQKDVMPDEQIIEEDIKTESQKPIVIFNTYDETINYNIQLTTNEIVNYISFEQYLPKRNIEKNSTLFLEENATYNKSKISEDTLFQSISPKF